MYMKKVEGFPFKKWWGKKEWMNNWKDHLDIQFKPPMEKSQKFYLYLLISQPGRREMKNVVASLQHLDSKKNYLTN